MSIEPGGVEIGGVEIAGTDASSGLFLYLAAFDGSAVFALAAGSLGVLTGSSGVSDIFYVAPDPDVLLVALDPDTFIVPPGRVQ